MDNKENFLKFPDNFFWGASTSSHQVEGGNYNDWTEWELANAHRLMHRSVRRYAHWLPSWNYVKDEASKAENYISGKAADHYNRYEEDFDIIKNLNMNSYRFSIEWSRIEPEEGVFNMQEIEHYKQVIAALEKRGITPFVTIWHWTFPVWMRDKGGFLDVMNIKYFERYVKLLAENFPSVKYWITINESTVYASQSYLVGHWPPERRERSNYYWLLRNIIEMHRRAYDIIHEVIPDAMVSVAQNNTSYDAYKNRWYNKLVASVLSYFNNRYFLDAIKDKMDFIGINYYFHSSVNLLKGPRVKCEFSDLGWEICANGIYKVLMEVAYYKKPIFITENGLADKRDYLRGYFIKDTLSYVHKAMQDGADIRGYMHWSLLDNFEWDKGFWPRFGLVEVNFQTQERKVRDSAKLYAEIIKNKGYQLI